MLAPTDIDRYITSVCASLDPIIGVDSEEAVRDIRNEAVTLIEALRTERTTGDPTALVRLAERGLP